jgi:hypothetical protein
MRTSSVSRGRPNAQQARRWLGAAAIALAPLLMASRVMGGAGVPSGAADSKSAPVARGDPETAAAMRALFEPLSRVLPLSYKGPLFTAPRSRAQIAADLGALASAADALAKQTPDGERGDGFVARALARDARRAARWYDDGHYREARFTLQNLTENCAICHSSLPEGRPFDGAAGFLAAMHVDQLPGLERAHLQVVARQFDAALTTYERVFRDPALPAATTISLGALTDYLQIALMVKSDAARPRALLEDLVRRSDLPSETSEQLRLWLRALSDLEQRDALASKDLDMPRRLLAEGATMMVYPRDRRALIQDVAASALLQRYVHEHAEDGKAHVDSQTLAKAYYLLGVAEQHLEHSIWITRSDYYFESAVRLAPGGDVAAKALAALEDSLEAGWSGSAGTHLPADAKKLIADLRGLVDRARTPGT